MSKKAINLKEGSIKENIDKINKRLVIFSSIAIILFITLMVFFTYSSYKNDPEFEFRTMIPTLFIPFLAVVFLLVRIIKILNCANNFEKNPIFKRLQKRFNFNDLADFERFDAKLTQEVQTNTIIDYEKYNLLTTNSYIIKYDVPVNSCFDIYDAKKLLLVVFTPTSAVDMVVRRKYVDNNGFMLSMYFEDTVCRVSVGSNKDGQALCDKFVKEYKVLTSDNLQLDEFYFKDRQNFIATCREEISKLYPNK